MPKASPFLASSNSGEFSPRMDARVDFDKYGAAISRGLNLICLPQGGLTARPGTRFVDDIGAHVGALFPFNPVADRAYMLHLYEGTLAIYRNQAQLAAAAVTATITNGTFDANIAGWTNLSTGSATLTWITGTMRLAGAGDGYAWAQQAVAITETTTTHVFRFKLTGFYGSKATVRIGTSSGGDELYSGVGLGMGWHTAAVTPNTGTIYFQVRNEQAGGAIFDVFLDDVEILSDEIISLTTPYTDELLIPELRTAQSADILYFFHDEFPIHKLERRGDGSWSFVKVYIEDGPWGGLNPETDLAATNMVQNPRFDNGMSFWSTSDSGNGYTRFDAGINVVQFLTHTAGAGTAAAAQQISTSALNKPHVLHYQIWGDKTVAVNVSQVSAGAGDLATRNDIAGWYSISFTPTASPIFIHFSASHGQPNIQNGITAAFLYSVNARLLQPSGITGSVTVNALGDFAPFQPTDVGRLLRFEFPGAEPGWGIIASVNSAQQVNLHVYRSLQRAQPCEAWRMGSWSDTTGWPHLGVFYQQRLIAARSAVEPQTIWASQTADFENLRPDSWVAGAPAVEDDDGLNFTIAADKVTPIMWLAGSRRLVVGTGSGQWLIVSSSNKAAITPSDFSADPQTSVAALDIEPVQVDNIVLFAQRAKRAIYDLGYSGDADSFRAADITILSDHITRGNVAQLVYQAEPFSNVWTRLEDGTLAIMTYKRGQNVVGWTPIEIAGNNAFVQSIGCIPGDEPDDDQIYSSVNRDELWMIVSRTIGNVDKNYIEVMEGFFDGPNRASYLNREQWRADMRLAQRDMFYVDCGATYQGAFTTTISGLDHLEGELVAIVADGATREPKIVTGGTVELEPAGGEVVHIGLPYDWVYRTLKLPYGSQTGAGVGQAKTVSGLVMVLRDSGALQFAIDLSGEGESEAALQFFDVPFRVTGDPMGVAVPLFSGEVEHNPGGGYASDPRVVMRGLRDGMPFTLLGISPKISESEL